MKPLVEPGPELTLEERERFSRHLLMPMVGEIGQRRLRAASVCVIGAGGLGSPVCLYLAAAGIGSLGIVDDDLVDLTNLQRQVIHETVDIGKPKTASARQRIASLTDLTRVVEHREQLTAENARRILVGYDLVIDCSDNFPTRYVVNDVCAELGRPFVWAAVQQTSAQISVFWRQLDSGVDLRDLFPDPPPPESVPSCAEAGVLGAMCGQVGSLMAIEAIKLICGIGAPLLGRVLVIDTLSAQWAQLPLRPRPQKIPQREPVVAERSFPSVTPQQLIQSLASPSMPRY